MHVHPLNEIYRRHVYYSALLILASARLFELVIVIQVWARAELWLVMRQSLGHAFGQFAHDEMPVIDCLYASLAILL